MCKTYLTKLRININSSDYLYIYNFCIGTQIKIQNSFLQCTCANFFTPSTVILHFEYTTATACVTCMCKSLYSIDGHQTLSVQDRNNVVRLTCVYTTCAKNLPCCNIIKYIVQKFIFHICTFIVHHLVRTYAHHTRQEHMPYALANLHSHMYICSTRPAGRVLCIIRTIHDKCTRTMHSEFAFAYVHL